jgi:hypothetical protein
MCSCSGRRDNTTKEVILRDVTREDINVVNVAVFGIGPTVFYFVLEQH